MQAGAHLGSLGRATEVVQVMVSKNVCKDLVCPQMSEVS